MPILYDAPLPAPNPRRVRIYLAEKGLNVLMQSLSIVAGEHKGAAFVAKYPPGQVPVLALDNGQMIGESVAICRYFEAMHPEPPLFGTDPVTIAEIDMWMRRVELTLMTPIANIWRHSHPFTARVVKPQYKEFGESNRPHAEAAMRRFDAVLEGSDYLAGDAYSMADILLLTTIDFAIFIGAGMPEDTPALAAWHTRISARPSASA